MTQRRKTDPDIPVALPIVPMLDLSFQILFFFMITFNPSKAEGKMSLNLPASGQAKAKDQQSVDVSKTSDTDLEVPADFVVLVRSYPDSVSLSIRSGEKVEPVDTIRGLEGLEEKERREELLKLLAKLEAELKKKLDAKKAEEEKKPENERQLIDNVKIEANGQTKYERLVAVMDACIRAGYSQVGFAPPPD